MKKFLILTISLLFLIIGCAKKVVKEPVIEKPTPPVEEIVEEPKPVEVPEEVPEPVEVPEVVEAPPPPEVVEVPEPVEVPEVVEVPPPPEVVEVPEEKLVEALEVVVEGDTIEILYMVRPNDYLIKIAIKEYGEAKMWRTIYQWNRAEIGDNPNLIFPFHEFLLKKLRAKAQPVEYEFYDYTVQKGESLWKIAGKEYGNNYAWIVILRDNADVLGSDLEKIPIGTTLKLRTRLW